LRSAHGLEVDEVTAVRVGLEAGAHRQAARDVVQLLQLSAGERTACGDRVGKAVEQRAQLVETVRDAVVQKSDERLVRVVRNALLCQRPLHERSSSSSLASRSAERPSRRRAQPA
jgi:hypothetical protein